MANKPKTKEPEAAAMSEHDKNVMKLIDASILKDEGRIDAVALMEAAVAAANGDRYIRNNALMGVARGFQASQVQIRDLQGRLDARIKARQDESKAE